MPQYDDLVDELIFEEGSRAQLYQDSRGFATIGIGRCIDTRIEGSGLSPSEQRWLLNNDVVRLRLTLAGEYPWMSSLNVYRQNVLIQLAFQSGVLGLAKFVTFLGLVEAGDFAGAATDLLATKWAKEVPYRAARLSAQMTTGETQYPPPHEAHANFKPSPHN